MVEMKLSRKVPLEGPNRCFVDNPTFMKTMGLNLSLKPLSLVLKKSTIQESQYKGDANIALGNGVLT